MKTFNTTRNRRAAWTGTKMAVFLCGVMFVFLIGAVQAQGTKDEEDEETGGSSILDNTFDDFTL